MKNLKQKSALLTMLAMCLSVFTFAQQDHNMMNMNHPKEAKMQQKEMIVMLDDSNLNKAYAHYVIIKEALFKDDTKKVQKMSAMLVTILKTYGKAADASKLAANLAKADKSESQRKLFSNLTMAFEPLLKGHVLKGTIYKDYCPMAGAYWFSNTEQIVNPYFGGGMTSCGSVKETIKKL